MILHIIDDNGGAHVTPAAGVTLPDGIVLPVVGDYVFAGAQPAATYHIIRRFFTKVGLDFVCYVVGQQEGTTASYWV